jgi:hypothetical protein
VTQIFESQKNNAPFSSWATRRASDLFGYHASILNDEYINDIVYYTDRNKFKKYKDSKVLIIGGGPSTNEVDIDFEGFDYLWSVNHFFLNEKLADVRLDMCMIMGEPNMSHPKLISYLNKFNPMIGVEFHDRWRAEKLLDYENYFVMHTDFYSKLGACVRMMIFAASLEVSKVSFIGVDGAVYIKQGRHAFEPGKTTLPGNFNSKEYTCHYEAFWPYVKYYFPNVSFKNLGYGQEYHKDL